VSEGIAISRRRTRPYGEWRPGMPRPVKEPDRRRSFDVTIDGEAFRVRCENETEVYAIVMERCRARGHEPLVVTILPVDTAVRP